MKGLLLQRKSAGRKFMKEKGKDWKAVSRCIGDFWEIESMVHIAERNLGVKPI